MSASAAPAALASAETRIAGAFAERGIAYPPRAVTLIAVKAEGRLEVWADAGLGWRFVRSYLVRAASGRMGPKLREGDHQVPEGLYRIEALNPESRYHLSLRVDYPNAFDRARALEDGRTRLGGDIMIHGGSLSDGCLPIGDSQIEEVFALASQVGFGNVAVIIAPMDFRRTPPDAASSRVAAAPRWLAELYGSVAGALRDFPLPPDDAPAVASHVATARPSCKAFDPADCVRRCERGDAQSCARAGLMYRQGRGAPADATKAWTFLRRACAAGDGLGCAELGQLYVTDDGPRRDVNRAAELATMACDAGDGHGCGYLVRLCAERLLYPAAGDGCSQATLRRLVTRAVAKLRSSCDGWDAYDCDALAALYAYGDRPAARRFAERSCGAGDPGGCDDLGRLYEEDGDEVRAQAYYRRACERGYATACGRLGSDGRG